MPLRHQLGADDDIDAAFRDFIEFAAHGFDRGDQVARQHHGARVRKQLRRFLLQAFDAGTDGRQRFLGRAMRADVRARHREAAMVTDQPLAKTMVHQPGVADRAGEAMSAGAAQCQRRVAAAIEEQQRLLALFDRLPDMVGEPRRDEAAARRRFPAQIDRLDVRHVLAAEPRRQRDALIASLARIDLRLDRRRGRRQDDRNPGDMRAHHRHVAGVIVRALILLVGLVVFLIDDDQAQIGIRQEQRRARADHDRRFAGCNRRPVARARTWRQFGVPFQRTDAEPQCEAVQELSGQCDLRHQDQRLLAAADDFGDRLEIDFGLARTGDAIEQRDVKTAIRGQRPHRIHRRALLPGKFRLRIGGIGHRRRQRRRHRLGLKGALIDQPVDHARTDAGFPRGFGLGVQQAVRQHVNHPPPCRRQAPRRLADQPHTEPHPLRAEIFAHPQRHAQHHAARRERVVGNPIDERAQFLLQRRHVELLADILQAIMQARIGIGVLRPHHGHHFARPQRHADDIAGLQLHAARHAIGIGLIESDRQQHIDDARRCGGSRAGARRRVHQESGLGNQAHGVEAPKVRAHGGESQWQRTRAVQVSER